MFEISDLRLVFFAAAVSFLLTPVVRRIVIKIGAVDVPKDDRRMHTEPIPSMGGVAIYFAFMLAILMFVRPLSRSHGALLLGSTVILVSGIFDDTKNLSPSMKVIFQLIAASIVMFGDVKIGYISNFFGERGSIIDLGILSYPITLVWIVGITNAVNLIDGMDGLAAGVSAIGAISLGVLSFMHGNHSSGLICLILAGACLGFLPYNFDPASVFMGDTGALFLGFVFSVITIEGVMKTAATVAIVSPILVLAVPIGDTFLAIIRRTIIRGESFATADKDHLHHKILAMGYSVRTTVIILYILAILMGLVAIVVSFIGGFLGNMIALGVLVLLLLGARHIGMLESQTRGV